LQRRLVRRIDLEMALSEVRPHPRPDPKLEQYTIPPETAVDLLFFAAYTNDDIIGRRVLDLGCGTGRLAIGAALLGAEEVLGVDVDAVAVRVGLEDAAKLGVDDVVSWVVGDIGVVIGGFDTVVQNPPFGVQRSKADRRFLQKALEVGRVVYSLHKAGASNRRFIRRFVELHGGKITHIIPLRMWIPWMFTFHSKRRYMVEVDLYRIVGGRRREREEGKRW